MIDQALASSMPTKPLWRGRIHQWAFFASLPLAILLFFVAPSPIARTSAAVYSASLIALFGTSAIYHRKQWSPRARAVMRRLDHSMIFLLIAGTYTPFGLLVLDGYWSLAVLGIVWVGAIVGIVLKLWLMDRLRVVGGILYIALGWAAVIALPRIVTGLSMTQLLLLVGGGVLYTVGAVMLLRRRPDPSPAVFGYHEVFHSLVTAAGACHYLAILLVVGAL